MVCRRKKVLLCGSPNCSCPPFHHPTCSSCLP